MRRKIEVPARPMTPATQRWLDAMRPARRRRYLNWGEVPKDVETSRQLRPGKELPECR